VSRVEGAVLEAILVGEMVFCETAETVTQEMMREYISNEYEDKDNFKI
jgi:hypothetical protein